MKINFSQHYLANLSIQLKRRDSTVTGAIPKIDHLFNMTQPGEAFQTWQGLNQKYNSAIIIRWYQLMRQKYPTTKLELTDGKFSKSIMTKLQKSEQLTFLYRRLCQPFLMRHDHLNNNYQSRQDGLAKIEKELLEIAIPKNIKKKDTYSPAPPTASL